MHIYIFYEFIVLYFPLLIGFLVRYLEATSCTVSFYIYRISTERNIVAHIRDAVTSRCESNACLISTAFLRLGELYPSSRATRKNRREHRPTRGSRSSERRDEEGGEVGTEKRGARERSTGYRRFNLRAMGPGHYMGFWGYGGGNRLP